MSREKNTHNLTDEQLIENYQKSEDPVVLGELYKRHTQFVFLVSVKYLKDPEKSEDMVMQVFEKLFRELKHQKLQKFKAWLHTVTRNECLMQLRSAQSELKKQQQFKKDEETVVEYNPDLHHTDKKNREKQLELLTEAVKSLKPEQQQCVDLFYLQEKSYVEVAELTGFSMKQVKSYIQNGKRNLKIYMERAGIPLLIITTMIEKML